VGGTKNACVDTDYYVLAGGRIVAWASSSSTVDEPKPTSPFLQALLYEVVAEPLDHHVALPGGHGLVVDADHEGLPGLLHGDASRSLHKRLGSGVEDREGDGWIGRGGRIGAHLLPADDGAGLALDDHVLGGAEEEAGRGQEPGLVEVLHDVGHLLRLELGGGARRGSRMHRMGSRARVSRACVVDLDRRKTKQQIDGDEMRSPTGRRRSEPRRCRRGR